MDNIQPPLDETLDCELQHSNNENASSSCVAPNGNLLTPQYGAVPSRSPTRSSLIKEGTRRHEKSKKSVSFGSIPSEKKISNVQDCLAYMQNGCELVKVRSNTRRYRRNFTLDGDCSYLRWTPTNKKPHKAKIPIDLIREIRTGKNSEALRNSEGAFDDFPDDCAFSVVWGDTLETLDLIATSMDQANIWVTGLMALSAGAAAAGKADSDDKQQSHTMRDQWLKKSFEQFGSGDNEILGETELIKLVKTLNDRLQVSKIKQKLKEIDCNKLEEDKSRFCLEDFMEVYKDVATRPEIYFLMVRYANKDYLTCDDFQQFLEAEQGLAGIEEEACAALIQRFEPTDLGRAYNQLSIDGFINYLVSDECDVFDIAQKQICQDMSQPLNHYFIASSHNTYLVTDQIKSPAIVDGYIKALQKGCRYIELDLWEPDGATEPMIYHGHTQTVRLEVSRALRAIKEYAFEKTEYPLIIHLENHLSIEKQKMLVELLLSVFGPLLYTDKDAADDPEVFPLPEQLINRILIKGKKLPVLSEEELADMSPDLGEVSEEDESSESNRSARARRVSCSRRIPLCKELSDLVASFLRSTPFNDFHSALESATKSQICSINEAIATRLVSTYPEDFIQFNKKYLSRVYPSGVRIDSSNFNPQEFWNCGCQIAAMNYQTPGLMMDLQDGKFAANGGCGYVLKPAAMREEVSYFSLREGIPGMAPQVLHLKIISAQHLPRPRGSSAKGDSCDPYVVVEVFGIPNDCAEERTKTVHNDSFNPLFDETFEFHIAVPELSLIRFLVLDDEHIGDDFIGQFTIPFDSMLTGYRHITLLNVDGEAMEHTTLFVHLAITNKRGGGKPHKRGRSVMKKRHKIQTGIKQLGIKQIDDVFKMATVPLVESIQLRTAMENALTEFQDGAGLPHSATMKQGFRMLCSRLQGSTTPPNSPDAPSIPLIVYLHDTHPYIESDTSLPENARKTVGHLERVISQCVSILGKADSLLNKLEEMNKRVLASYDDLGQLCLDAGLKEQKATRASENFAWNVRVLKGQTDILTKLMKESADNLLQIEDVAKSFNIAKECPVESCSHFSSIS